MLLKQEVLKFEILFFFWQASFHAYSMVWLAGDVIL